MSLLRVPRPNNSKNSKFPQRKQLCNGLKFSKYHGAGNDFILVEDFEKTFPHALVKQFCDRRLGIGADGLILAQPSSIADYQMVYFNADGSHAGMCGNGLRCFVHFLRDLGKLVSKVEVAGKVLTVKCIASKILIFLPLPKILHWKIELLSRMVSVVDVGVPHVVVFADDEVDVLREGRAMRYHEKLLPEGANVNFFWKTKEGNFRMRTYERGVENETLACGTGAVSCAFVANRLGLCDKEVAIQTSSNEILEVRIGNEVELTGPSEKVFDGLWDCKTGVHAHFFK
ncbi:MAG: Diaminopimelate epimerase [Chlamydiae bacterium]|nr:Diaminopimelate epimerase [Chlamydiota bacterium]